MNPRGVLLVVAASASICLIAGCQSAQPPTPGSQSRSTSAATSQPGGITAFGALRGDWLRTHPPDTSNGHVPDCCFDAQGQGQAEYYAATFTAGRVLGYYINFSNVLNGKEVPGPPIPRSAALALVVRELPTDAAQVYDTKAASCEQLQFKSATLGPLLADPQIGDGAGLVDVVLTSDGLRSNDSNTYYVDRVTTANLSLGIPGDAGPC